MAWNGRGPIRICDSAIEAKLCKTDLSRQTPANQAVKTSPIGQILGNSTILENFGQTNRDVNLQMFAYQSKDDWGKISNEIRQKMSQKSNYQDKH